MRLTLPWPPSVNSYWLHRKDGHTYLTERAHTYRSEVHVAALMQKFDRPIAIGRLKIEVDCHPPDKRIRDLDNICKGLLDALKYCRLIRDDGDIDDLHIRRLKNIPHGAVHVEISTLG